jgi:hypothetical protein
VRLHDLAALDFQRGRVDAPLRARQLLQQLARDGRGLPQLRRHVRRRAAAERAHVEGREVGVAHDEADRRERRVKLLRDGLRQRRARVLAELDLAGEDGDGPVLRDVEPGGEVGLLALGASGSSGLLARDRRRGDEHDDATQELHEAATADRESVGLSAVELVTLGLERGAVGKDAGVAHAPVLVAAPPPCRGFCAFDAAARIASTMRG